MASDSAALPIMGIIDDPRMQTINITGPDGEPFPVPMAEINTANLYLVRVSTVYASQIGACFVMLAVVLAMTPKHRFTRVPTLINIFNLALAVVRLTLLATYFSSSWVEMYTFYSGDVRFVTADDWRISLVATALSIPQTLLVLSALIVQAWSMVQLWPSLCKWPAIAVSTLVSVASFGFKCASVSVQIRVITEPFDVRPLLWIRLTDVSLMTATIAWFCFLFNVRLVMHMWTNRSILPTTRGLTSMDVLVMANGILMLIPVVFTAFQFVDVVFLESGSLVLTTVVLVLPFAALVAQRLSGNPASQHRGSRDTDENTLGSKKRFLDNYSHHSTTAGPGSRRYNQQGAMLNTQIAAGPHSPGVPTRQRSADPIDLELQRIDDDEDGNGGGQLQEKHAAGGVRVNRSIERREERI